MNFCLFVLKANVFGGLCQRSLVNVIKSFRCFSSIVNENEINSFSNFVHKLNSDIYLINIDGSLHQDSGPFDRAEICEKYSVEPRDLQKIDTDLPVNVPLIDVRHGKFICCSFRRHRSLIQSNRSIFFVPSAEKVLMEPLAIQDSIHWQDEAKIYQSNLHYIHQIYNQRLKNSQPASNPFEFQMTEIILDSVAFHLKRKSHHLLKEFENLRELTYQRITVSTLRDLALLKERIDQHKRNADLAQKAILDVLAHDEDLIGMYLTDHRQRDLADHIQIELLLEASAKQMAEVCRPISDLSDSVQTLQSAVGFMLDAVRNELLAFEIRINIITMGFGLGALIAGIYGMNLYNGFEQQPYAFYVVTGSSVVFITATVALAMKRLLSYRKVRLHRSHQFKGF